MTIFRVWLVRMTEEGGWAPFWEDRGQRTPSAARTPKQIGDSFGHNALQVQMLMILILKLRFFDASFAHTKPQMKPIKCGILGSNQPWDCLLNNSKPKFPCSSAPSRSNLRESQVKFASPSTSWIGHQPLCLTESEPRNIIAD